MLDWRMNANGCRSNCTEAMGCRKAVAAFNVLKTALDRKVGSCRASPRQLLRTSLEPSQSVFSLEEEEALVFHLREMEDLLFG